jgi:hypothetical protein
VKTTLTDQGSDYRPSDAEGICGRGFNDVARACTQWLAKNGCETGQRKTGREMAEARRRNARQSAEGDEA